MQLLPVAAVHRSAGLAGVLQISTNQRWPNALQPGRGALPVYKALLTYLQRLRGQSKIWTALPAEVNRWWRSRRQMSIVPDGKSWRIEGPDADRARLAYAKLDAGTVRYVLADVCDAMETGCAGFSAVR